MTTIGDVAKRAQAALDGNADIGPHEAIALALLLMSDIAASLRRLVAT